MVQVGSVGLDAIKGDILLQEHLVTLAELQCPKDHGCRKGSFGRSGPRVRLRSQGMNAECWHAASGCPSTS